MVILINEDRMILSIYVKKDSEGLLGPSWKNTPSSVQEAVVTHIRQVLAGLAIGSRNRTVFILAGYCVAMVEIRPLPGNFQSLVPRRGQKSFESP